MTYRKLYESAINKLEKSEITLGEFEKMIEPLNAEVGGVSDTISRQQAIDVVKGIDRSFVKYIEELPPAQPKRGKWILDGHHVRCDQCGMYMCNTDREGNPIPRFFCPNCGAEMEATT